MIGKRKDYLYQQKRQWRYISAGAAAGVKSRQTRSSISAGRIASPSVEQQRDNRARRARPHSAVFSDCVHLSSARAAAPLTCAKEEKTKLAAARFQQQQQRRYRNGIGGRCLR